MCIPFDLFDVLNTSLFMKTYFYNFFFNQYLKAIVSIYLFLFKSIVVCAVQLLTANTRFLYNAYLTNATYIQDFICTISSQNIITVYFWYVNIIVTLT